MVDGGRIKLAKKDSGGALIRGHHRFMDKSHVADVEGNQARLSVNADVAVTMEKLFVSRSVTPRRQTASTCFNRGDRLSYGECSRNEPRRTTWSLNGGPRLIRLLSISESITLKIALETLALAPY